MVPNLAAPGRALRPPDLSHCVARSVIGGQHVSNRLTRCPAPVDQIPRRAVGLRPPGEGTTWPVRAKSCHMRGLGSLKRVDRLGVVRQPNAATHCACPRAWCLGATHVVATHTIRMTSSPRLARGGHTGTTHETTARQRSCVVMEHNVERDT